MSPTPALVLAMWAAGLAAAGATVAYWRVVGPGFLWLTAGVALLVGGLGAAAGAGIPAWAGTAALGVGAALARHGRWAGVALGIASLSLLTGAIQAGGRAGALSGSLLLGGVTGAMILGHWYLIDPRLPRWAMRRLVGAGLVGLVAEVGYLAALGALDWDPPRAVIGWSFLALGALTLVLLGGVWYALREPAYAGMMAATGLSYLAVITALAVAVTGRTLVG